MKSASQVLREARAFLSNPANWLPGSAALGGDGRKCIGCSMNFDARATGYFDRALSDYVPSRAMSWNRAIYKFNADPATTHADVMAAFDRAIALAEKDEPQRKPRESDSDWAARMVAEVTTMPSQAAKHSDVTTAK